MNLFDILVGNIHFICEVSHNSSSRWPSNNCFWVTFDASWANTVLYLVTQIIYMLAALDF